MMVLCVQSEAGSRRRNQQLLAVVSCKEGIYKVRMGDSKGTRMVSVCVCVRALVFLLYHAYRVCTYSVRMCVHILSVCICVCACMNQRWYRDVFECAEKMNGHPLNEILKKWTHFPKVLFLRPGKQGVSENLTSMQETFVGLYPNPE
jgi:hypothetical protein